MKRTGVGVAVICAVAACSPKKEREKPVPEAGYITVSTRDVPLTVELAGRTAAYEMSDVRPQVSGIVRSRLFTEGSLVRQGQTLYQIDSSLYRAAARQAQANLASARAAQAAAAALAERYRPLAQIEAVSKQEYANAVASAGQAAAAVEQNRAALETANINLGFTRVPAPITGRIGRSLVTTGALVTTGQADPMTTIQRLDPIFVDIQQSSAELLTLRRSLASGGAIPSSTAVRLTLEDGSTYPAEGRLEFSEAMVAPDTGTVTLRARFPNPQGVLLPGMYVRAQMSQQTLTNGILVPQAGLSRNPRGEATVLVVSGAAGNKGAAQTSAIAQLRTVKADRTYGAYWLVTSGLKPGEKVIVEGLSRIKPGQPIRPLPAGSKPKPPQGKASGPASR
ncbi:efflux RND transporter periplasmic adaptor subunit [Sphingobium subterraneum]|nr:efflux RND transporter periplasmic adaptor subunit [Sphingobium subterraneum]